MRVAIYNLHFAALGGGERRSAALAAHLGQSHDVTLFVLSPLDKKIITEVFGIDLSRVTVVALEQKDQFAEIEKVKPDIFINNSHGSDLPCLAPVGIYMCMFPDGEKPDLGSYGVITANSQFTAKWILKRWGYESDVVYSACEFMGPPSPKQKTILNVGRFFEDNPHSHHKRQDVLIEGFRKLEDEHALGWELHLVGNVGPSPGDRSFLEQLRAASAGYPIRIFTGLPHDLLREEYRKAAIYWHATGYGWNEDDRPSKQEHLGMTILEAMSAGAIPLAFDGGGPRETITTGVSGYLWADMDELTTHTCGLASNASRMQSMSTAAVENSRKFGVDGFLARMDAIIARLTSMPP